MTEIEEMQKLTEHMSLKELIALLLVKMSHVERDVNEMSGRY